MVRTHTRFKKHWNQRRRRKGRFASLMSSLNRLRTHYDFDLEFGQYLGLPAFIIRKGPDRLILMARHGAVYLNQTVIRDQGIESGLDLIHRIVKREFRRRK